MTRARVKERRIQGERRNLDRREADRHAQIPDFIQDGQPLIRGTQAWAFRERARARAGCSVKSFGRVELSQ